METVLSHLLSVAALVTILKTSPGTRVGKRRFLSPQTEPKHGYAPRAGLVQGWFALSATTGFFDTFFSTGHHMEL